MIEEIECCTCNKKFYRLKNLAKRAIKKLKANGDKYGKMRVYPCPDSDGFHLTSANANRVRYLRQNKLIRERK